MPGVYNPLDPFDMAHAPGVNGNPIDPSGAPTNTGNLPATSPSTGTWNPLDPFDMAHAPGAVSSGKTAPTMPSTAPPFTGNPYNLPPSTWGNPNGSTTPGNYNPLGGILGAFARQWAYHNPNMFTPGQQQQQSYPQSQSQPNYLQPYNPTPAGAFSPPHQTYAATPQNGTLNMDPYSRGDANANPYAAPPMMHAPMDTGGTLPPIMNTPMDTGGNLPDTVRNFGAYGAAQQSYRK